MAFETQQPAASVPAPAAGQAPGAAVHILDYWQIFYSRKEIVIAVALLLILSGIVITRRMPQVYASMATIEVQRETPNVALYGSAIARYDPIFLRSQFEIIKSNPVLEQVVDGGDNLADVLGLAYGYKANETAADNRLRVIELIKRRTTLSIRRDTDLIDIEVRLDKPEGEAAKYAQIVANSIAEVFRDHVRRRNMADVEEALSSLSSEIASLGREISEKENELSSFRELHQITITSSGDYGAEALRRIIADQTAKANQATIEAEIKKTRYERVVGLTTAEAAASLPILVPESAQFLAKPVSEKQEFELQMAALKQADFGDNHPKVVQTRALLETVEATIAEKVESIKSGVKQAWEQAQTEADLYKSQLQALEEQERSISSGPAIEYERLQKDLDSLKKRRTALQTRLDDERVNLKMPKTSVRIIDRAKIEPRPVSPNFALNVTLSVVAGLLFGVLLAFFVEYLDTTVKNVEDVEKWLQANVIGIIPQKMRALNDPNVRAKHSEVYRVLRMNLKSSKALGAGKVVVFTSASAGEGKSMTSFNTAWVCAEVGEKVLLVDADLHRPRQHRTLGVPLEPGLANVVVGEAALDDAIVKTEQPNLDFLPAGSIDSSSIYGLMDTDEMSDLVAKARERYDRVIVDAPPMIGISDTAQLTRLGDGVVLVIQHRKYPRALCKRAKDNIISMGGNFLGVVLNNVNSAHDSSSYYYEHQYYYYYYTQDSSGRTRRTRRASTHHHGSAGDDAGKKE
ncbi:MAG: polysaccharide biosynthesis tyrosine autokinase [Kiritimatiellae bacterium]|nr:polysaccharide biosynthesis tyrosine autokinase [Kiritimatiellia bacterium]